MEKSIEQPEALHMKVMWRRPVLQAPHFPFRWQGLALIRMRYMPSLIMWIFPPRCQMEHLHRLIHPDLQWHQIIRTVTDQSVQHLTMIGQRSGIRSTLRVRKHCRQRSRLIWDSPMMWTDSIICRDRREITDISWNILCIMRMRMKTGQLL